MNKRYLIIPGNPAIESHYRNWMKEIKKKIKNVNLTYATSYVIFDKKLNFLSYNLAMRNHYEKILLKLTKKEKVSIIAYSAGGYFAFRLLEKYPEKIEKVIVLYPYIGYDNYSIIRFVGIPYFIDRFFPLSELVSHLKFLFYFFDYNFKMISSNNLTANLRFGFRQCFYFNKNKPNFNGLSKYKKKIYSLYTKKDRWCPKETINLLKSISNSKELVIPHGFICYKDQRIKMIKEIKEIHGF